MKKIILAVCLLFIGAHMSQAQLNFGIKGGINYNSNSIKEVKTDVFSGAESKTGFHAGIWIQAKLPVTGLFIRPELVYTQLSNTVAYKADAAAIPIGTSYDFRKIDIPVLIGKKIFSVGRIFIGPTFQYILEGDFGIDAISDVEADGFTMGLQLGAGVDLGKLGLDVRWERGFSDTESSLINTDKIIYDTRVNQIIIGLSYKF